MTNGSDTKNRDSAPSETAIELTAELARSRTATERMANARALAALGPDAAIATNELLSLVEHGAPSRAAAAAFVLSEIGPSGIDVQPALIQRLEAAQQYHSDEVRQWIAVALRRLAPARDAALDKLIGGLEDSDEGIVLVTLQALGNYGAAAAPAAHALLRLLRSGTGPIQEAAAEVLPRIAPNSDTLTDALLQDMKGTSENHQCLVLRLLGKWTPWPANARRFMGECLRHPAPAIRAQAVAALAASTPETHAGLNAIVRFLSDIHPEVRLEAAKVLTALGKDASHATGAVIAALADSSEPVRLEALRAIEAQLPGAPGLQLAIERALRIRFRDPSPAVQAKAVRVLNALVPCMARPPEDAFVEALSHPQPKVRQSAAEALGSMRQITLTAHNALANRLRDPAGTVRIAAVDALVRHGMPLGGAVALFLQALEDADATVQIAAIRGVLQLQIRDVALLEALDRKRVNGNPLVQELAGDALAQLDRHMDRRSG